MKPVHDQFVSEQFICNKSKHQALRGIGTANKM